MTRTIPKLWMNWRKKRLSQITETSLQKEKRKLADYLLYRGWESDLVYGKVHELI